MEPNAVVATTYDPFRADFFLIRGTQRMQVSLVDYLRINPGPRMPSYDPSPFLAAKSPEALYDLVRSGRPGYLLLDFFYGAHFTPADIAALHNYFEFQQLASVNGPDGKPVAQYFFRLIPNGQQQRTAVQ